MLFFVGFFGFFGLGKALRFFLVFDIFVFFGVFFVFFLFFLVWARSSGIFIFLVLLVLGEFCLAPCPGHSLPKPQNLETYDPNPGGYIVSQFFLVFLGSCGDCAPQTVR